jgi:ribosomal protein S18 acetylase RimI-like enzyme
MIADREAAFHRAFAFVRELDRRASSRVERLPFGTAYLRPELPHVWSRNFVSVEAGLDDVDLDSVLETTERIHLEAGLLHRRLAFDHEAVAGAAALRLQSQGWRPGRVVVMPHRGPQAAPAPPRGGREVDRAALEPLKASLLALDPQTRPQEVSEQLLGGYRAVGDAASERSFAYEIDGALVASCRLYSDGSTAQVEDVGTLPEHRGKEYGNAVVLLALQEAWAAHDFVFIEAEEADWPKDWYVRIGFEAAGVVCDLVRDP